MKGLLGKVLVNSLLGRSALGFGRRPRRAYGRKMWRPLGGLTRTRRRNRRRRGNNRGAIEINRAVGGRKSIAVTGPIRYLTVEMFGFIGGSISYPNPDETNETSYQFFNSYSDQFEDEFNIASRLNQAQEFNDWRAYSSAFKVLAATMTFNQSRVHASGENYYKLIIQPETDIVNYTGEPSVENNTMIWDMNESGTKNYNVVLNRRNTYTQDLGWQASDNGWTGTLKVKIGNWSSPPVVKTTPVEAQQNRVIFGDVKFTVRVAFRLTDRPNYYNKQINDVIPTKIKKKILDDMVRSNIDKIPAILAENERLIQNQKKYKDGEKIRIKRELEKEKQTKYDMFKCLQLDQLFGQ